jgi:hypothetical protein
VQTQRSRFRFLLCDSGLLLTPHTNLHLHTAHRSNILPPLFLHPATALQHGQTLAPNVCSTCAGQHAPCSLTQDASRCAQDVGDGASHVAAEHQHLLCSTSCLLWAGHGRLHQGGLLVWLLACIGRCSLLHRSSE